MAILRLDGPDWLDHVPRPRLDPGASDEVRMAWVVDSRAHRSLFGFPSASDHVVASPARRARLDRLLDGLHKVKKALG